VVITVLALFAVAACGIPTNDFSATERNVPNSVNVDAGPLALRHLRVEIAAATATDESPAAVRGSFLNHGPDPDALLRVTTPAAATVTLTPAAGEDDSVALQPGELTRLQRPEDSRWALTDLRGPLTAGSSVDVTFHFANQPSVTASIPVSTT
jgi:copper(I)-binding protein